MGNSTSSSGGKEPPPPPADRTAQAGALPLTEDVLKKHVAAGSDDEEASLLCGWQSPAPRAISAPLACCCSF